MVASTTEQKLWTCQLSKEKPLLSWIPTEPAEEEDDEDYVQHSLIIKAAVLGLEATESQRNLVAIKTGDLWQPILSLTLGKNDMVSNLDIIIERTTKPVEFKLLDGAGPVCITCHHIMELPALNEQETMLTSKCEDMDTEEEEEDEETEETEEEKGEKKLNGLELKAKLKAANGLTNGHKEELVATGEK